MAMRHKLWAAGLVLSVLTATSALGGSAALAQSKQTASTPAGHTLHVSAIPVRGAQPMDADVRYTVEALDGNRRGQVVASGQGSSLSAELPPGRYRVSSVLGLVTTRSEVSIVDGPVDHQAILNAGGITLALMPHFGAPEITEDIDWVVWTYGRDALGNRWEVARVRGANPALMLPEGYYVVTANHRGAEAKHTIEVTAGNNYNYAINLNAGTMRVFAEPAPGADPGVTVLWRVFPQGSDGTGEPLASGSSLQDSFFLPSGRYLLVGLQGDKQVRKEIEVSAGKKQSVKVKF